VRVLNERLSPGMQHAQKADLGAETLRVGGYFQQRVGDAAKQQVIQETLVLEHQLGKLVRHRKDDMKVVERHQFPGACRDPAIARLGLALRTVAVAASNGEISITCLMGSIF